MAEQNPNLIPPKAMESMAQGGTGKPLFSEVFTKVNNAKVKSKKVRKMSTIKNFIVIEPGLVLTLKKDQLLTEDELLHYQREFGEDSFIVKKLKK